MNVAIPKVMGHIWVGNRPAPTDWIKTWHDAHPDWTHVLYDNAYLLGREWRTQPLITEYFRRGRYEGVSDLMRYEILFDEGGFIPEADSICLRNCDELFDRETLYTVYENETVKPGMVSPFLAAAPQQKFLFQIIRNIRRNNTPETLKMPWRSVGNRFLRKMIAKVDPDLVIFPSHYFVPQHKNSPRYDGSGPIYAEQMWGTTLGRYDSYPDAQAEALQTEILTKLESR